MWLPGHFHVVAMVFWIVCCVARALLGCRGCSDSAASPLSSAPSISRIYKTVMSSNLGCDIISQRQAARGGVVVFGGTDTCNSDRRGWQSNKPGLPVRASGRPAERSGHQGPGGERGTVVVLASSQTHTHTFTQGSIDCLNSQVTLQNVSKVTWLWLKQQVMLVQEVHTGVRHERLNTFRDESMHVVLYFRSVSLLWDQCWRVSGSETHQTQRQIHYSQYKHCGCVWDSPL